MAIDPFGRNSYQTAGWKKKEGQVTTITPTMLSAQHIENLEAVDLPIFDNAQSVDINFYRIYDKENDLRDVCRILGYQYVRVSENPQGFKETSLNRKKEVVLLQDAVKKVPTAYGTNNGVRTYRTYYPCYLDTSDNRTLRFVVIIRPGTEREKIEECDRKYTSLTL